MDRGVNDGLLVVWLWTMGYSLTQKGSKLVQVTNVSSVGKSGG